MTQHFDVIIVGGGVIGCSAAYHLAQKRAKVMVLDRGSVGGALSTTRSGSASLVAAGMLAAQEEAQAPDAFFELCLASSRLFETLAAEVRERSRIDPEWEACGIWRVAENEGEKQRFLEKKRWQEQRGLPVEWWPADQFEPVFPSFQYPFAGALYCPTDGQINNVRWIQALAEAARRDGVRFMDYVSELRLIRDNRRVTGVQTHSESYSAQTVLLTSGAWTALLLSDLRVALPLEPVKGQVMVLSSLPRAFRGPVYAGNGYLVPKADGRLIIGATSEKVGFHPRPTLAGQRFLADWVARWCPSLAALSVVEFQAGLRPATSDGWPVMGPVPEWDGLHVCTGHFRNGILLSPISGRYMADGLMDNRWDPLGQPFSLERFLNSPSIA
jgi:glycine oxidase